MSIEGPGKKTMTSAGEKIFAGIILLMLALFIYLAFGYKPAARIVPLIVAIPAFGLMLFQLYLSLRKGAGDSGKARIREPAGPARAKTVLGIWLWLIALIAAAYFLGLLPAALLFMFCFLRFFSRKSWLTSATVSTVFFTVIYLLFHSLLEKL